MAARRKRVTSRKSSGSKKRGAKKAAKKAPKRAAKKAARRAPKKPARRAALRRAPAAPRPAAAADPMKMPAPNGRPVPSDFGLAHHHMDYTSHDVEGVRRFYSEVLGFTNTLYIPEHGYLTVFVSPRSSFGFMAPMPNMPPESWSPPGEPTLYFFVDDVDRAYRKLLEKGVSFDQTPADMPWGHRLASFRDPEGRRVCIARQIKK